MLPTKQKPTTAEHCCTKKLFILKQTFLKMRKIPFQPTMLQSLLLPLSMKFTGFTNKLHNHLFAQTLQ